MAYYLYHTQYDKQGESYTPEAVSHRPQRLEEKKGRKRPSIISRKTRHAGIRGRQREQR